MLKKMMSFLMVLLMFVALSVPVYADGSVTFYAFSDKFIFEPGTKHSPTSLFGDFQNVMPGDRITDQIQIINDKSNGIKLEVYMRALGAHTGSEEFLSQMNLTVSQKGNSPLFDAPVNETAQLTDWVYIGTVYSGGKITLDVTLDVPITMGNEFKDKVGFFDWQFKIEKFPSDEFDPTTPQTGDSSNILLYACLMLASAAALLTLFFVLKRRKRQG